jgi:ribosomal protein L40E
MALKVCRECKKKVSTEATSCPKCGVPNPTDKISNQKVKSKDKSILEGIFSGYESESTSTSKLVKDKKKFNQGRKAEASTYYRKEKYKKVGISDFLEGEVDLGTAFWGYGVVGLSIVGFVCGILSAAYSKNFEVLYIIVALITVSGLWRCASTYNKIMKSRNKSITWGVATQVICVLSVLSTLSLIKDLV